MTTVNLVNPFWGSVPPSRYWRLRHLAVNGSTDPWPRMGEVIFAATSGGAQIATGGTAIGSTGFAIGREFANAFDGLLAEANGTRFISPQRTTPGFVGYDFGSVVSIGAVGIVSPTTEFATTVGAVGIEYSNDNINWLPAEPSLPLLSWGSEETRWIAVRPVIGATKAQARIWRVANWTHSGGIFPGWHKTFFRATSGGAQLATGGQHYGNRGTNGGVSAWRCFDGSLTSSLFGVAASQSERFVQYVFPTAPNPAFFAIRKPTGGNIADDPESFDLQWSCDGVNFTTALSVSGLSSMALGEEIEWAIP